MTLDYGNRQDQWVEFQANIELSYLSVTIDILQSTSIKSMRPFHTVPASVMTEFINATTTLYSVVFMIQPGAVFPAGRWQFGAQINIDGVLRNISNDRYTIQTGAVQTITGHF